ncbi:MAG: sugar phosphate isomerase/epimerase family protein [Bryobacteraceae bacterium]
MRGSTITLADYQVEQAMDIFREAGFSSVEMWVHHLKQAKTDELRRAFAAYAKGIGLGMGGLNVVGEAYFQPFGTEAEAEATLTGLKADIDFARSLGTGDVLIWEGRAPAGSGESEWLSRLLPRLVEILRAAIDYAKPYGMRLLAEPHPFTVGMSDRFLIKLCDALDPAHFGITYDFCHYGVGRQSDYVDAIYALGGRIRHLHFSDSDQQTSELHFPVGRGRMDIQAVLGAFREIRYRGTMTLDLYGYPTPVEALAWSILRMRQACDTLGIEG